MASLIRIAGLLLLTTGSGAGQQAPDRVRVNYVERLESSCENSIFRSGLFHCGVGVTDKLALARLGAIPQDGPTVEAALQKALENLGRYWKLGFAVSPFLVRTAVQDKEDLLVVKLQGSEQAEAPVPVLFWSNASADMIVYGVAERFVRSPEWVRSFLDGKAVWSMFDQGVIKLRFQQAPISNGVVFRGYSSWDPRMPVARQRASDATGGFYQGETWSGQGYIVVSVSNRELPERFPPLATRVRSWTTAQLLAETKRGDSLRWEDKVLEREAVILRELVTRGDLGVDDLSDVLKRGVATPGGKAGPQLASGLRLAWGSVPRPVFVDAVRMYVADMQPLEERLAFALRMLVDYPDLDLQADANRVLRAFQETRPAWTPSPHLAHEALNYLRRRGNTADALSAIEATSSEGPLADDREKALEAVRNRIQH